MEEGEVAESKRHGGDDAVDERLDEAFDDAVDDDTQDDYADDIDDETERPVSRSSRSAAATRDRVSAPKKTTTGKSVKSAKSGTIDESLGLFGRIARFVREVVAELRKVNWPSRNELITYTLVVLIFVVVMILIVAGLDYGFAWAVGKVFGGK
jgi:preprotein translocase subunit SecE